MNNEWNGKFETIVGGLISTSPTVNINYETLAVTSYLIYVMVYDGIAYTTSSLTVTIADVNEAPSFSKNLYYANGDEGSVI